MPAQLLGPQLGLAIGGHRPVAVAVDRGGGGEHQAQAVAPAGGLQQPLGGEEVVAEVELVARAPAGAHARLARQVEDHVDAVQQRLDLRVGEVGLPVTRSGLQVDPGHLVPPRTQGVGHVRADEARAAGHERPHAATSATAAAMSSRSPSSSVGDSGRQKWRSANSSVWAREISLW